ncbi:hypothetical protein [Streptomyces sp. NPDC014676]|uniref:hypothetical protein n=1 Tax=Streptomyces sp. NPDC014676 TaxID=3364879 RepID=UPI0036FBC8B2
MPPFPRGGRTLDSATDRITDPWDRELLEPASSCHPRTLRQMRWTNTMIEVLSPQLLVSA